MHTYIIKNNKNESLKLHRYLTLKYEFHIMENEAIGLDTTLSCDIKSLMILNMRGQ